MFITRKSSDVQLVRSVTAYHALFMLIVLILTALNNHIHNPYMFLSVNQECSSTFVGVIFKDENQDGAFGLNEHTLDGLVTLQSQTGLKIQKYETDKGFFIPRNVICGIYEVIYEDELVGEVEVKIVMSGEVYAFAAPTKVIGSDSDFLYEIYLPYIVR